MPRYYGDRNLTEGGKETETEGGGIQRECREGMGATTPQYTDDRTARPLALSPAEIFLHRVQRKHSYKSSAPRRR